MTSIRSYRKHEFVPYCSEKAGLQDHFKYFMQLLQFWLRLLSKCREKGIQSQCLAARKEDRCCLTNPGSWSLPKTICCVRRLVIAIARLMIRGVRYTIQYLPRTYPVVPSSMQVFCYATLVLTLLSALPRRPFVNDKEGDTHTLYQKSRGVWLRFDPGTLGMAGVHQTSGRYRLLW